MSDQDAAEAAYMVYWNKTIKEGCATVSKKKVWINAWLAGRESLRAELEAAKTEHLAGNNFAWTRRVQDLEKQLEAERARSAKLIEALRFNLNEWPIITDGYKHLTAWQKCRDAIAEYEGK